ncbi:MAG: hypothetical protein ACLRMZ_05120 [Blautia marasmi]
MNRDALPSMVQNLGLQQTSGVAFGDMGMRYEGSGIEVEWHPDTNGIEGRTPISISCENNSSVSMEGIRCGSSTKRRKQTFCRADTGIWVTAIRAIKNLYQIRKAKLLALTYLMRPSAHGHG